MNTETIKMNTNEIQEIEFVINELAKKLDITIENHTGDVNGLSGFAEACDDSNSIDELVDALSGDVDQTDCKDWDITPDEWIVSIREALSQKLYELKSIFVEDE